MATAPTTVATPASSSQGIQVILDAEKDATKIVQAARKYRIERLKAARAEALAEIEELKRHKMEEYAAYERQVLSTLDQAGTDVKLRIESQLRETEEKAKQHKKQIVALLLEKVLSVKPQPHQNEGRRAKR